ncbi:MAG: hypothetical protein LBL90_02960 [Prevotellaceae bacterium]|jgi:Holliday junction resolvase|nr:hypothetical protein [Prevotellaceae bacterium]
MKTASLIFVTILLSTLLSAQDNIFVVNMNTDLAKVVNNQYLFSRFADGRVLYKNNSMAKAKLNYNVFLNELQFIENGDTLAVANPEDIPMAVIDKYTLVNLGKKIGFVLVIEQSHDMQLAMEHKILAKTPPAKGAYGIRSETASTTNIKDIITGTSGTLTRLPVEVKLASDTKYYLINRDGKAIIANKKNFLKTFSNHKKEVEQYIAENKTDFSNVDKIKELFNYCVSL